jgi:hypothetical protein
VDQASDPFASTIRPTAEKYCLPCHGNGFAAGGLNLAKFNSAAEAQAAERQWRRAMEFVKSGHMPPPGAAQPTDDERAKMAAAIDAMLRSGKPTPGAGRASLRRLNRLEYRSTLRDLLGIDFKAAEDFPADNVAEGFDNIGEALTISPLLMEKYLDAAMSAAEQAIALPAYEERRTILSSSQLTGGVRADEGFLSFYSNGKAISRFALKEPGPYQIRLSIRATQAGPDPARVQVDVDGRRVSEFEIKEHNRLTSIVIPITAAPPSASVSISFVNDYYDASFADPDRRDRNVFLEGLALAGPMEQQKPAFHQAMIPVRPEAGAEGAAARAALKAFLRRAWRRTPSDADLDRLAGFAVEAVKDGEPYEQGLRYAVAAALASPRFLFRPEQASEGRPDGFTLASRLSYFLWSSMPDDRLLDQAEKGALADPKVLAAEASRMLKDPRADALGAGFGGNWLQLGRLADREPDPDLFPSFSEALKRDMERETLLFFRHVVQSDSTVMDFVTGQYSFLNQRLARFYGVPGPKGDGFELVNLSATPRTGVLTHGSVLVATSNPTRTSPVKRGKWILEQVLGSPPPPPPPGADSFPEDVKNDPSLTFRQKLERHRESPACAGCHQRMDPLGFGLENFDAVGRWRDEENGKPLDAKGEMPGGVKFEGPLELRRYLSGQKNEFAVTFARKLLTYALGRVLQSEDEKHVFKIAGEAGRDGMRFSAFVRAIVQSEPFLTAAAP